MSEITPFEINISDAEITVPEVDTTDSAAAQEEFLSSCTS